MYVQFAAEAFEKKKKENDVIEVCFDPERWRMKESSVFQFMICCSAVIMDDCAVPCGNKSLFNSTMILKQHLKVHLPAVYAVQI